ARVHRMGQHRPVQVFNLVMRDSIEERVLRTLAVKRSLFTEIFTGTNDEVSFATLGQQTFLETARELVGEGKPAVPPAPTAAASASGDDPRQAVVQAGIQLLEALAALLGGDTAPTTEANGKGASVLASLLATDTQGRPVLQLPIPSPEALQRGSAALRTIARKLAPPLRNGREGGED
ncbi:MAG: hypothetical protein ACRELF_15495, partial [Gemmataceae bacterium]